MNVLKKTIACIIICILFFGAGYLLSNFQSSRKHSVDIAKYEARLDDITKLNNELKNENSRITDYNIGLTKRIESITNRLDSAKTIIDGLDGQTSNDGDTVQRLIDNVQRLEQSLSIIFTGK